MKTNQKLMGGLAGMAVVLFAGTSAFGLSLGNSGTADNGIGIWQVLNGGELYVKPLSGPVNNSAYAATTKNQGIADSFQSFCLELAESIGYNGLTYVVNDEAVLGGNNSHLPAGNQGGDLISVGTAYLYSGFAQGTLALYNYGAGRLLTARKLQLAIWALEDEIADPAAGSNVFFDAAVTAFGTAALAQVNAASGSLGVFVLNMTTSNGTKRQDVLVLNSGASVPDGGATLMLLGLGLGGISLLARNKKLSKAA